MTAPMIPTHDHHNGIEQTGFAAKRAPFRKTIMDHTAPGFIDLTTSAPAGKFGIRKCR
jgi:hypothetical protein